MILYKFYTKKKKKITFEFLGQNKQKIELHIFSLKSCNCKYNIEFMGFFFNTI